MEPKDYNPLNEGYTGRPAEEKGYTGSGSSTSQAPATITNVQSGVVKPNGTQTSISNTTQNKKE